MADLSLCLTQFYSSFAQMVLPREYSKGFGLRTTGSVAAGFHSRSVVLAPPPAPATRGGGDTPRGIAQSDAVWGRGATIKVVFLDGAKAMKDKVEKIATQWHELSGADFRFEFGGSVGASDVRVTFRGQGFWSRIGREAAQFPGQGTLNLGFRGNEPETEIQRLVLHEFGHAIGMIHEHKHPKGGIQFDKPKALAVYRPLLPGLSDQDIWEQLQAIPENSFRYKFFPFDVESIMLYSTPEAAVKAGTYRPEFGRNNTSLSKSDLGVAREMYGVDPTKPIVTDGPGTPPLDVPVKIKLDTPLTKRITKVGEAFHFSFAAPKDGAYEITTEGDAIVHIDLTDATGKPTKADDPGEDSISPSFGIFMLRLLDKGEYRLKVTASRFSPLTTGSFTLKVRHDS